MIGIVIVSHSEKLATGVLELVDQMVQGQVPLAAAGGIDDPENPIGTDPMRVQQAIEDVYSEDGVLVLMDLGSALLSAEMALEFLTEAQQANIRLCSAPLIEGAVAAAVQALATNNLDQIAAEARSALQAKIAELGDVPLPTETAAPPPPPTANEIVLEIRNFHGLHARPAAQFVGAAAKFQAQVSVRNVTKNSQPVNAKSINQVATLGARQGHLIGITAAGSDADQALTALQELVAANFGEAETAPDTAPATAAPVIPQTSVEGELVGIAVSPGIAIGPAVVYEVARIEVEPQSAADPTAEWQQLQAAVAAARAEISALYQQAKKQVGTYEAAIFEAHQLFLDDPALLEQAQQTIEQQHIDAAAAWQAAITDTAATYRQLDDPYLQARAADVEDVGQRVLRLLTGAAPELPKFAEPSILVAHDLSPSDTAQLDPLQVLGICTELGSATSHSAILARALGIPAVVGLGTALTHLKAGTSLAIDGQQGRVWIAPNGVQFAKLKEQQAAWQTAQQQAKLASHQPAITTDGQQVEIVANIGGPKDVAAALAAGAEGVGLFRTEFLFLGRTTAPTETEQIEAYRAVVEPLAGRPLVIRTLDIGGDKPLPYMNVATEENPFLGWRGIRMMLDRRDVFKTQLRAILQVSHGQQIKIMFPMVSTVDEVRTAKAILAEAQAELRQAHIPFDEKMEVGIMVEVPATVAIADQLAAEVDFFSIGTNDLSQYTMAADRTNPRVSALPTAFQPAVLRLIKQTIEAGHAAGIWVGLCGEFAGEPLATPVLLGLGLDEFSMSAPAIPAVKQAIRRLGGAEAQKIADTALGLTSAAEVRAYLEQTLPD